MATGAFSQNFGKLFSELKLVTDKLSHAHFLMAAYSAEFCIFLDNSCTTLLGCMTFVQYSQLGIKNIAYLNETFVLWNMNELITIVGSSYTSVRIAKNSFQQSCSLPSFPFTFSSVSQTNELVASQECSKKSGSEIPDYLLGQQMRKCLALRKRS